MSRSRFVTLSVTALALLASGIAIAKSGPGPAPASEERAAMMEAGHDRAADAAAVYFIHLEAMPLARYRGGIAGLAATSPRATGAQKVDVKAAPAKAYLKHLADRQSATLAMIERSIGREVEVMGRFRVAYNTLAVYLYNSEAEMLEGLPGIRQVEREKLRKLQTDVGPEWIGADHVWDGTATADAVGTMGEGIVIGVIDSGVNTDHPSFAEVGPVDGYVHSNPRGQFYGNCDATTGLPYCNQKLIGAYDCSSSASTRGTARVPDTQTVTGSYPGSAGPGAGCGAADVDYNFPLEGGTQIVVNISDNLAEDITVDLLYNDPFGGFIVVASQDLLTSPETLIWAPASGVPAGDYRVQVCPFAAGQGDSSYVGTITWDDSGASTPAGCGPGATPEDFNGHGSHTASTSGGNFVNAAIEAPTFTLNRSLQGVAPHANLITYLTCAPTGNCVGLATVAAIEQATIDQVDVINYSIGGGPGNPWSDADAQGYLAAREAGIWVATSASNDGPGAGSIGSPADAPWITTVGASTHSREILNSVVNMSGGNSTAPADINGKALTAGYGPATIVYAGDEPSNADLTADPALCAGGDAMAATNPWAPGTFTGEIVVCDRGTFARVDKCANVCAAGAGGCVLANNEASGDSLVADGHACPSVHITYDDGVVLKAWLADGASDHTGTISGTVVNESDLAGDVQAGFSSRGPNSSAENSLKPDVTNPGVDILAAISTYSTAGGDPLGPPEFGSISGTSMSSPHTAGSYALLRSKRPEFTPAEAQSAMMMTTTREFTRDTNGTDRGDPLDRGAGRVDLTAATRAGLVMDVVSYGAGPGDAKGLNIPSLADVDCDSSCTWTREVKSAAAGSVTWTAGSFSEDGVNVTVTPSVFTLAPGATQVLTFTADIAMAKPFTPQGAPAFGDENETQDMGEDLAGDPVVTYNACQAGIGTESPPEFAAGDSKDCWVSADVSLTSSDPTVPNASIPLAARSVGDFDNDGVADLLDDCPLSSDPTDADLDGVPDACDNCLGVDNPSQCDTDFDGYGNHCDADLNNNLVVNFVDLSTFKDAVFSSPGDANWNANADMNCNDVVNIPDLAIMKAQFFGPPGPSAIAP